MATATTTTTTKAAAASRWKVLGGALLVITSGGTVYSFGSYSSTLKSRLNLSQTELDVAALCANVGTYIGSAGFVVDRFGATNAAYLGSVLIGLGYTGLWLLALSNGVANPAFAVSFSCFVWGHGAGYLDAAAISVSIKCFPKHRGAIVGLAKSLYGLASSLVVLLAAYVVGQTTLIAVLASIAFVLPAWNAPRLEEAPCPDEDERATADRIDRAVLRVVFLAIAAAFVAILRVVAPGAWTSIYANLAVSVLVLVGLVAVTSFAPGEQRRDELRELLAEETVGSSIAGTIDYAPARAVREPTLWLLFVSVLPIAGAGLATINNLGQIMSARGAATGTQDVAVTMVSVANCLGRLAAGRLSDALSRRGLPRTGLLVLTSAIACVAMLELYATGTSISLALVGVVAIGGAYGMLWTLIPTLTSDIFGMRRIGSNYMLTLPSVVLGSVLFSTVLASTVYSDHESRDDDDDDDDDDSDTCTGSACFATTFLVTAAACLLGTLAAAALTLKTRHLYQIK
ncbi:hypothetical protein CTAYLR_002505 [Chrysophaeum taylorii]|uniref:Nodulin-like domain-containing protein n=1 Tax=Chrysophaeum taylorii TaxID=2483200 RepID=A0AAD7UFQ7_9STRA|nr:hypothetical protein CTAYLR_002505 [Chrysophaeum taylorii]